jgi:hypothetical protein
MAALNPGAGQPARLPIPTPEVIVLNVLNGSLVTFDNLWRSGLNVLQDFGAFVLARLARLDDERAVPFNRHASTSQIALPEAHGWTDGTPVMVATSGGLPGGLAAFTVYYLFEVTGPEEGTLAKLTTTPNVGASAVTLSSDGTGLHTIRNIRGELRRSSRSARYDVPDVAAATLDPLAYGSFRLPATCTTNPNVYSLPDLPAGVADGLRRRIQRNIATAGIGRVVRASGGILASFSATDPNWIDVEWSDADGVWTVVGFGGTGINTPEI